MRRREAKRAAALALLIIGAAGVSAIATLSFEGRFAGPVIVTERSTLNLSSMRFNSSIYLSSDVGPCRGPAGYSPCFGDNFSQAELFNCASAAASASGCTQRVASSSNPQNSFQITIWYPYVGHNNESSWANCVYTDSGDPGQYYGAYCVGISSTSFIVTEPAPPPL
jgi:hypothetical protein